MLKNYFTTEPPVAMNFNKMSDEQANIFMDWFCFQAKSRIEVLSDAVQSSAGYEEWRADSTPESLILLGHWFKAHVGTKVMTQTDIEEIYLNAPEWFRTIPFDKSALDIQTMSLLLDISMYMAQVLLNHIGGLNWYLEKKKKKDSDYHFPVLKGFTCDVFFNPIRILHSVAYGFIRGTRNGDELKRLFDVWKGMTTGNTP